MACRAKVHSRGGNDRRQSHIAVDKPAFFHFFRIIVSTTLEEKKLRVPHKFVRRFGDELTDVAEFIVPDGRSWKVGLSKAQNKIWFDGGWQNFAEHHSIGNGYFLVFGYRGFSCFSVIIFDATASEIMYPLSNEVPSSDEICNEVEMEDDQPYNMLNSIILSPSGSSLKSKLSDASANTTDSSEGDTKADQKHRMKQSREGASLPSQDFEHLSRRNKRPKAEQLVEIVDVDNNEIRREKGGKRRISELDEPLTIDTCETESLDECEDKEAEIIFACKKSKRGKPSAKSERAMAAARMYMPKNPSFMVLLGVYSFQNRVYVPVGFSRYLDRAPRRMKLEDPDGREWEVKLHRRVDNHFDIRTGWNTFCKGNNLGKGDVCVFELMKNKEVLKVSIFR